MRQIKKNSIFTGIIGFATTLFMTMIVITTAFAQAYYEPIEQQSNPEDDYTIVEVPVEDMTKPESIFDVEDEPKTEAALEPNNHIDQTDIENTVIKIKDDVEEVKLETLSHTVSKGDSYWSLSKQYYNSGTYSSDITEYNGRETDDMLHVGDELIIPELDETTNTIEKTEKEEISTSKVEYSSNSSNTNNSSNAAKNNTGEVDTSSYTYIGDYKITGYTPGCVHCCGNDKGITASGTKATVGRTIATYKDLPFGTQLYIEGYGYYIVEDRGGFNKNVIDIAAASHEDCYELTASGVDVFIVPN